MSRPANLKGEDWSGRSDAEILIRASEIMDDEKRFCIAKKWVGVRVSEAQKALELVKKVADKLTKTGVDV